MGILDLFRRAPKVSAAANPLISELLRFGVSETASGIHVDVDRAMKNTAMFRAVTLISNSIGMLPMHVIESATKKKADAHPLFRVLHRRPNTWQSAFDFRSLMQLRALVKGNAYALVVRGPSARGGQRVTQLVPLDPDRVTVEQAADWTVTYAYQPAKGGRVVYPARDILHLRGVTLDGLNGLSLVKQAAEAVGIAVSAELATARLMKNGTMAGGVLKHPGKLSAEAYQRLKESLASKEGAENAGKSLILEEGMDHSSPAASARDSQLDVLRKFQVEEIGRVTGVPRPLLMVDETSWGSGIEALGQFFVMYALGPWIEAWQQACERTLLDETEVGALAVKINPAALLRGSMAAQADFLAKALGAGGSAPWMWVDEVRDVMDLPEREAPPHTMVTGATNQGSGGNAASA
ncbi:phage portal protein [Xanthobacter autotrophicus]|uniref:phage portal protein n=1 Tax=Xanthobacter autotrophicus TaxID=280 RepID=UPI003727E9D4